MNFFDYKFFHFIFIIIYVYNLMLGLYNPSSKIFKISLGISSLLLLISGVALMGRFGIPFEGPYPLWIWAKILVWIILSIAPPILIKRAPKVAVKISILFIALIAAAAFMAIYKP